MVGFRVRVDVRGAGDVFLVLELSSLTSPGTLSLFSAFAAFPCDGLALNVVEVCLPLFNDKLVVMC